MDSDLVKAFADSTQNTFRVMLGSNLKPAEFWQKRDSLSGQGLLGIIQLSGDLAGSLALIFPDKTAAAAVSRFLGMQLTAINDIVFDGIGELANIVAGHAKFRLEPLCFCLSLPSVVQANDGQKEQGEEMDSVVVPFTSELGNVALEIRMRVGNRS